MRRFGLHEAIWASVESRYLCRGPELLESGCNWGALRVPDRYLGRRGWRSVPLNYNQLPQAAALSQQRSQPRPKPQAAFHLNQNGSVRTVNAGPPNRTVVGIGTSSSALPIGDIGSLFQRVRCHCPCTEISAL